MEAGPGCGRLAMAWAVILALAAPAWAQAQGGPTAAMDGQWHFNLAPARLVRLLLVRKEHHCVVLGMAAR
jgi:hypothetical protein